MRVRGVVAVALLCGTGSPWLAGAQEWAGSFVVTSDYVFRGQSQSQGDPVLQGDLHWQGASDWFAGAWASMVELHRGRGPTSEINLYAGRAWPIGRDWRAKLVGVSYIYPKDSPQLVWDYEEALASLAFRDAVIATIGWSPGISRFSSRGRAVEREAVSYELAVQLPWRARWTFTGGAGYYDLDQLFGTGYLYWSGGLTYTQRAWQLMLTRTGTSGNAATLFGNDTTADRWSLAARWQFGSSAR